MTPPLYELQHASVRGQVGPVLDPFDLELRDHAVTVIVGPVGSGKSTLLRLLSGRPAPDGWTVDGRWYYRDARSTAHTTATGPHRGVAWVPQIPHAPGHELSASETKGTTRARIDGAFFGGAKVVLLDEPTRGMSEDDRRWLVERLREHSERGAAIVVSHDLAFTREVADDVCLLCDGSLVTCRRAHAFFEQPDQALAEQFVREGTCSMPPAAPTLPMHFWWLEPGRLAGMGRPGLLRELDDDLFAIAYAGVDVLVSLTEEAIPSDRLRPFGIAGRHLPIRDMGVPSLSDALSLCHDLLQAMERGRVVALHCRAGLGRTGTIAASLLVCRGRSANDAIAEVRRAAPLAIQNEEQAAFVRQLEAYQ